jgi:hypothetical protein
MLQVLAFTSGQLVSPAVVSLEEASTAASDFANASKSAATRRAYQADAADFAAWCQRHRVEPLPASADTVAAYLAALARSGLKASTITRRCAGIRYVHRLAGFDSPTNQEAIKAVLTGIRHGGDEKGASNRRNYPRHHQRDANRPAGTSRPRVAASRLCGGASPFRTRRPGRKRPRGNA